MEQVTDVMGNPAALLIERFFWLGLGVFFSIAIITSFNSGSHKRIKINNFSEKELENLAKKAMQQNDDF